MASIIRTQTKTGVRYFIQLSPGENESRPKISLGKITKRQAETAKINIENLVKCCDTGSVLSTAVQEWVSGISDGLRKRLEVLGLIEARSNVKTYTVAEWTQRYIKSRPDVKEITTGKWQNAANKLAAFFRGQYIEDVTVKQAKDFRVYLKSECGLAENTLRRLIGLSRQFFNAAVEAELIAKNPFMGQSVAVRANPARFFYVTQEMALKVLEACPDSQWRLIFGLARWGGLRCPSEVLRLKWQDIDFEQNQFVVHSLKTEHHADSGIRTVPMFPELKPLFQDAFDNAREGDVYCITRYRDKSANMRTTFYKIIARAGLKPWPKAFQNLRSTRETELFKMTNGNVKAVCSWIGNSPEVAMQHYAQVTEADLQEAAKLSLLEDAENRVQKTVHNPVQTAAEPSRTESHEVNNTSDVNSYNYEGLQEAAIACNSLQNKDLYPQGDSNPCYRDENPAS
jgi:integrase